MNKNQILLIGLSIIIVVLLATTIYEYVVIKNLLSHKCYVQPDVLKLAKYKNDCGKSMNGYDVLFFYSPIDPHSINMIKKINNSTLKFFWINVYNSTCKNIDLVKYGYIGWTPYFYCLHNGLNHTGEMNNYTWNWFVENCR